MTELIKLRQQQQSTRAYLQQMEVRLQSTERKQQQMMSFLARAMQNPEFIHQLVHHKEKRRELEEAVCKKRRRPIEGAVKAEPLEICGFQVSELEALAMEMQGLGRGKAEAPEEEDDEEAELDDGFWEDLLSSERFDEERGIEDGEDANSLARRLGFLASSSK